MRVASRHAELLKTYDLRKLKISGKSQNFRELYPSSQFSYQN